MKKLLFTALLTCSLANASELQVAQKPAAINNIPQALKDNQVRYTVKTYWRLGKFCKETIYETTKCSVAKLVEYDSDYQLIDKRPLVQISWSQGMNEKDILNIVALLLQYEEFVMRKEHKENAPFEEPNKGRSVFTIFTVSPAAAENKNKVN